MYGIFSGCYSDWHVHGYFKDIELANKFCALKNKCCNSDHFYIREIEDLEGIIDLSKICIKYEFIISIKNKGNGWEVIDNRGHDYYEPYESKHYRSNAIVDYCDNFILFKINIDKFDFDVAMRIALDYLYRLLAMDDNGKIKQENVELMDKQFKAAEEERIRLENEEKEKKKELTELKRLLEKYPDEI